MKVVLAGGGTAGHVNPAIAVAGSLTGAEVTFLGTERGVETKLVAGAGYPLKTIEVKGFDRSRPWTIAATGTKAVGAILQARRHLGDLGANVVVGMGGYVSLPACYAARSLKIPVVLHEQNIVLGLAHRACRGFAKRVAVSFEETLKSAGRRSVYTGNPILPQLVRQDREAARVDGYRRFELDPTRKTLLVFGGSLGARSINEAAAGLATVWRDRADLQVLHITGSKDREMVSSRIADTGDLIYRLASYVEEMGQAYAVTDLAICRGGATTVAEVCALGVPSLIVPYPHHRDQQQLKHGRALERRGAARVIEDAAATSESFARLAGEILTDEAALTTMGEAARSLGRPHAAVDLAAVIEEAAR
jgi:UDP-N-acetylglucosamine--N-acetylmuramyl-(pentapeptide) pyrophosphoryl-undecaprenol N-acetylglucosamine transferase